MTEVYPGIFSITEKGSFLNIKPPINVYVVTGSDGLVFDAGYGNRGAVRRLVRELAMIESRCRSGGRPCRITRILPSHTHPDHFSGLRRVRDRLGLSVMLTPRMARLIRSMDTYKKSYDRGAGDAPSNRAAGAFKKTLDRILGLFYQKLYGMAFIPDPDILIGEDSDISVNGERWVIFPSPGHSDDHISLYDPARGILFAGDNVLRSVTTWLGPPQSDLEQYIRSLEEMLSLPKLELILSAHGSPVVHPRERIREIIEWRRQRTGDVLSAVRESGEGGITLKEILRGLYREEGAIKLWIARGWVKLTLDYLERTAHVSAAGRGLKARFYIRDGSPGEIPAGSGKREVP